MRRGVEVVEEDPTYPPGFLPVRQVEVLVAPGLEARVVGAVVLVAGRFDDTVEVFAVVFEEV